MIDNFIKYIEKNEKYIIFDIGSRDCLQSIEFYKEFPNSIIYAFECNPNTLDICKKNIEPYSDRIILIEGAVCDYDGYIKFYPINQSKTRTTWIDGNPGASSIFKSNGNYTIETYVQDEIITKCHRLDTIMDNYGIVNVDIIWMDLQGAELLALKGLGDHLENVKYINTEVSYKEMYSGQVMFDELNNYILSKGFDIKNTLSYEGWQEDVIYEKKMNKLTREIKQFDIVIPIGEYDKDIIYKQIELTKKNIIGYRNIYLICNDPNILIEGCITINENIFPFSIESINKMYGELNRNNWYLQQLLKLYSLIIIPGIKDNCLIIDADTFFLKPTKFIRNNKCLYNFGNEYHRPYFEHMSRLDNDLIKVYNVSGICHHMMFEKTYINNLIDKIEKKHNDKFYNIFLKMVSESDRLGSGASEYEIYFNYVFKNYKDSVEIRELKWCNTNTLNIDYDYDYISYHHYSR